MTNRSYMSLLTITAISLLLVSSAFPVTKTSRIMNFIDFYAGGSTPVGERDGLPDYEFLNGAQSVEVKSEDIYDNTFHLGMTYGQLRYSHFLWSIGWHYTDHKVVDTIPLSDSVGLELLYDPTYRQVDIDFNFNFYLMDLMKSSFSPYTGLGIHGGILKIDDDVNSADYSANLGLSWNFGADLKIWSSADARSFVTLSSVNSYDFYGSNDRPEYLNIGGAVKYYFRP